MSQRSFLEQWLQDAQSLARHVRKHIMPYAALLLVLALASTRYSVGFNISASLPYRIAIIDKAADDLKRGDLVVYRFHGVDPQYGGRLNGQWFFKRLSGIAGDRIAVDGRNVYVNGEYVGFAKQATLDRKPLGVISAGYVPPGFFYAKGDHPDSFDSRYQESGLIAMDQLVGKAHVLF